jgi:hypothetical protein
MGEANYYLKARFQSDQQAEAARPRLAELLAEGEKAYRYWQDSRSFFSPDPKWQPPSVEMFWKTFWARYPLVCRYLRRLAGTLDWNNGLAGWLGCLVDPRNERRVSLFRVADTLFLRLNSIWHGTQMDLLERYCREDLGALGAGSVSDEDFDLEEDEGEDEDFDPFLVIDV